MWHTTMDRDRPDQLLDLRTAIAAADGQPTAEVASDIEEELGWPGLAGADTLVVGEGSAPLGWGLVLPSRPGSRRTFLFGGVHPDHRGRGIGREVLGWQLVRAAGRSGGDARVLTNEPVGHPAARLYARFGLLPERYYLTMAAPTAPVDAPDPLPVGLRAVRGDALPGEPDGWPDRIFDAHVAAFTDHWGWDPPDRAVWLGRKLGSRWYRPDLSRLALDADDRIAGYLLAYLGPQLCEFGQIGTGREWRRRGIAGTLLRTALRCCAAAGIATVGLGVDGDSSTGAVQVYARAGFTVTDRRVQYARDLTPADLTAPAGPSAGRR